MYHVCKEYSLPYPATGRPYVLYDAAQVVTAMYLESGTTVGIIILVLFTGKALHQRVNILIVRIGHTIQSEFHNLVFPQTI
jgi:hypothetical protein